MYNSWVFGTFSTFAQKIFKGCGCNFTWSFGKVMPIKSLKMVYVASIISHKLCMIYAFFSFAFVEKSFLTKKFFLCVEINLTTRGPLYTCLVLICFCSKIVFYQNFFSFWWDKLDYPGSIVYLSCCL